MMYTWKEKLLIVLSYILVAVLATVVTLFLVISSPNMGYTKLEQLQNLIEDRFVDDVDKTKIEDAAAYAMIEALGDRWSYYIPADEYAAYQEQMKNAYVGIGVTVVHREDKTGLEIQGVTEGGPAQKAGVLVGDLVTAVDGQPVGELDSEEVRNMIRGKSGTKLKLTLIRGGEELELTVERKEIQTPVAAWKLLDGGIGLVTIENFDARCAEETIAAIEAVMAQGANKLIFDVRHNPGGYKNEMVKVLDYLLPEGVLFRSENYKGETEEDTSDAKCLDVPMAVLVNGSSYSAAEFFAAALREYDKAVVVGEKTTGKGHFQNTFQLNDGSAVGLSVGRYYTPNGVSLEGVGLTPDREVPVSEEIAASIYLGQLNPMEDPQILAAVEAISQ